jgi:WD40 repeat protein
MPIFLKYGALLRLLFRSALVLLTAWLPLGAGEPGEGVKIVATLKGHAEPVYAVDFSPDGKYLVTASFDNTLKLWETATGKELKTLGGKLGHQKMVLCVAFSPDGRSLASGGGDNSLKIWDVPSSSPVRTLAHEAGLTGVALSPDGSKVAGAANDGVIKIWRTNDYELLFTLKGHQSGVRKIVFSPNNQFLASSGEDGTVRFWNAQNGQPIVTWGAHHGSANAVAWHPNNQNLYSVGEDGYLRFWPSPTPQQATRTLAQPKNRTITAMALSPDNSAIFIGCHDHTVLVCNLGNGQIVRALVGAEIRDFESPKRVSSLAGSTTLVAAGYEHGRLLLWGNDGKPLREYLAHPKTVTAVSLHPQNSSMLSAGDEGLIRLWTLPPRPTITLSHPEPVLSASLNHDGSKLYSGSNKTLRVWNVAKGQPDRQFNVHSAVTAVAASRSGQILVSGGEDGTLRFWDQGKGMETLRLGAHNGPVRSLAILGDDRLLTGSEDGTAKLWRLPALSPRPFVHPDQISAVAISTDGEVLLTGCTDKQVRLWNLRTGEKERDFAGPQLAVTTVALSSDGKTVAAGSADKTLTLWSSGDARLHKSVSFPAVVKCVAFKPDNKMVAVGLEDSTIVLVDPVEGKEVKKLTEHKGAVTTVAFTSKGDELISASTDKRILRWNANDWTVLASMGHSGPVSCLALNREGTQIAACAEKSCTIWSIPENNEIRIFQSLAEIRGIAFGPVADTLVLAGQDSHAHVYGLDGKRREFFPHDGPVSAVAVHPRDRTIITGSADKLVRVWNSTQLWQRNHPGPVRSVLFGARGDMAISTTYDGKNGIVRFLNLQDGQEKLALHAHQGPITGVAVTSDAGKLITAGSDKFVKLWDLKAGPADKEKQQPLATVTTPEMPQQAALSPSGTRLAVALGQPHGQVRIYELPSLRELVVLKGHLGNTSALAFRDENSILSVGGDSARIEDVGALAAWPAHQGRITALNYHPNGTQALSAGADKIAILWDINKRAPIRRFDSLKEPIADACFSRDGAWVAATGGKTLQVWNTADGKPVATIALPASGLSVSLSPDRSKAAVVCDNRQTHVYEIATGSPLQYYRHGDADVAVAFPDNSHIVRADAHDVSIETLSVLRTLNGPAGPLQTLAVSSNGASILTAGADKGVKVWNTATGNMERVVAPEAKATGALAVSKSMALLALGGKDRTLRVYTFGDGKLVKSVELPAEIGAISFCPNDREIVAASDSSLRVYDAVYTPNQAMPDFLRQSQEFNVASPATGIALANDNRTFFASFPDKALRVFVLASDVPTKSFPHPNYVNALSFQPQGGFLASGGQDGKVRIFDLAKGVQSREINAHPVANSTMIYGVAWTPDGKQVLTAGYDNSLKLLDASNGNTVREFKGFKPKDSEKGHKDSVFCAAISPDGKFVASGSGGSERLIKVWNLADGSLIRDLINPNLKSPASHPGWVYNVRFTREGKYLVSVGDAPRNKGYLAVWNVEDGKLLLGQEMALGAFFSTALSPESGLIAIGAGSRGRPTPEWNSAYIVRVPLLAK